MYLGRDFVASIARFASVMGNYEIQAKNPVQASFITHNRFVMPMA